MGLGLSVKQKQVLRRMYDEAKSLKTAISEDLTSSHVWITIGGPEYDLGDVLALFDQELIYSLHHDGPVFVTFGGMSWKKQEYLLTEKGQDLAQEF